MASNVIYGINGPVVTIRNTKDFSMMEMVHVGNAHLIGEVIGISDEFTTVQVYEETTGLKPGEPVFPSGGPLSVTLGPGILSSIFDGIMRPLDEIAKRTGDFIERGCNIDALDPQKEWDVSIGTAVDEQLNGGDVYATCPETSAIVHKCIVSPSISGKVIYVGENGKHKVNDVIVKVQDSHGVIHDLTLAQKWPIRIPRPVKKRLPIDRLLVTGQRVIDSLFPIAKGGTAAIPGGFGAGKTMTQHQLAKWCDADIIVYVGCGERGNEMTEVLEEFAKLIDPKSHRPLTDRTILIANTSNMPVAAREASIYTGITLAEYYRDMGYHVALMADSTSRWAEALREISGRLEEMPAEEGFPAYLPSRLSEFYERAGYMQTLCGKEGSITVIGAVSPQGGDFSEPVTQNTKRFIRCFLALDKSLAYARHYPAINWLTSYSEYVGDLADWYTKNVSPQFIECRTRIAVLLQEENRLMEIVKLIGSDVLPEEQKLIIEVAKLIRVGFLQQNAYHAEDTYVPLEKQMKMMVVILHFHEKCKELITKGVPMASIVKLPIYEEILKMKYDIANDKIEMFDTLTQEIDRALSAF